MHMNRFLKSILFVLVLISCNNLEDVNPAPRSTFIHFYGGSNNFIGRAAEVLSDGFLIAGDSITVNSAGIVLIKTDEFGNQQWRKVFGGGQVNAIKVLDDGYLLIGDSIQTNVDAVQVSDLIKRKMRLIKVDLNGNKTLDKSFGSFDPNLPRVDLKGYSIAKNSTDSIYSIGSIRFQGERAKATISSHDPATLKIKWSKSYELDNRDYISAKSSHVMAGGEIIWATSATLEQTNSNRSYVAIPVLQPNSSFNNNALFGRNDDIYYSGNDIQAGPTGYGIIGTRQTVTGANANLYFVRTDPQGNIIPGSEVYFDGELSSDNTPLADKDQSNSQDEGSALINTSDGGFLLAGSMTTTTVRGNGGRDAWIIRIDPFGTVLWNKNIGGIGDETISTVRQTSDGGFLICGTLNLAGLASIFVLKTDKNGELKN